MQLIVIKFIAALFIKAKPLFAGFYPAVYIFILPTIVIFLTM